MDGSNNRDNSSLFFSGKENDDLAQRLLALHTTIKNTPAAPEHDLVAFDRAEALFMRDAQVIEKELASARVRCDASIRNRHPNLHFASFYPDDDRLSRDTSGDVYSPIYDPIEFGCRMRQSVLLMSSALVLLWKAVGLSASCFGPYEVHVTWTLVGLFLGLIKQPLGHVPSAICSFLAAPLNTLKIIFDLEMEFRRQLQHDAAPMPRTQPDWASKSGFSVRLCLLAMVEHLAFHFAGVELGFGLCCLYFAWFTTLSFLGVEGWLECRPIQCMCRPWRLSQALKASGT